MQAQIAEWFGEAPANEKACDLTADQNHCDTFHAGDTAYWENVYYWETPTEDCADGRTDVTCTTLRRLEGGLGRGPGFLTSLVTAERIPLRAGWLGVSRPPAHHRGEGSDDSHGSCSLTGPTHRFSAFLHRHAGVRLGGAAVGADALVRRHLPRGAGAALPHGVLDAGLLHARRSSVSSRSTTSRQVFTTPVYRSVAVETIVDRRPGDGAVRGPRTARRLLSRRRWPSPAPGARSSSCSWCRCGRPTS